MFETKTVYRKSSSQLQKVTAFNLLSLDTQIQATKSYGMKKMKYRHRRLKILVILDKIVTLTIGELRYVK